MDPRLLIEIRADFDDNIIMQDGTPPVTQDVDEMREWINHRVLIGKPFYRLNNSFSTFDLPQEEAMMVTINGQVHIVAYFDGRSELSTAPTSPVESNSDDDDDDDDEDLSEDNLSEG